jgi:pimeloyl-ACP methyl ester carboxylesterase
VVDDVAQEVFARLQQLRGRRDAFKPEAFCREFWAILRLLYVTDPADAGRVDWGRCDLPNERAAYRYWTEIVLPSIQVVQPSPEDWASVLVPVLVVHGRRDRSAPYGGGRDWARSLREARLVTVPRGGHAPWIEAPEMVFGALRAFLDGGWPAEAERVSTLAPPPLD